MKGTKDTWPVVLGEQDFERLANVTRIVDGIMVLGTLLTVWFIFGSLTPLVVSACSIAIGCAWGRSEQRLRSLRRMREQHQTYKESLAFVSEMRRPLRPDPEAGTVAPELLGQRKP